MTNCIQWQAVKQPKGLFVFFPWNTDPHIVTYADIKRDLFMDQFPKPIIPDKFTISQKSFYAFFSEQVKEAAEQCSSFTRAGVPSLGQHRPKYRNSHTLVGNTNHKDIDIGRSILPIGTV